MTTVVVVLNENWKHQYERLNRSLRLVQQLGEPTLMPQEIMNPRDVLYHFCCDALHLRDWIVAAFPVDELASLKVVETLNAMIRRSPDLAACADVALASKHLVLTRGNSYSEGGYAEVVGQSVTIGVPPAGSTGGYYQDTFQVPVADENRDAREMAENAVAAWRNWLDGQSDTAKRLHEIS